MGSAADELRALLPIWPANSWQDDALCAQVDPVLFFPDKGGTVDPAKRLCARCDVENECREFAVENFIREGVWGGTSGMDRVKIWKARRMEVPNEEEIA